MKDQSMSIRFRLIFVVLTIFSSVLFADEIRIETVAQKSIRPSYPFPEFLSTAPYIWYENVEKKPIKGHTYRIATFTVDREYHIYLEKVIFGIDGCCLEIVDYRELLLNKAVLKKLFPDNNGKHGFKLINWRSTNSFIFEAFSGTYLLSNIDSQQPLIEEIIAND